MKENPNKKENTSSPVLKKKANLVDLADYLKPNFLALIQPPELFIEPEHAIVQVTNTR